MNRLLSKLQKMCYYFAITIICCSGITSCASAPLEDQALSSSKNTVSKIEVPEVVLSPQSNIDMGENHLDSESGKLSGLQSDVPECSYLAYSIYKNRIWTDMLVGASVKDLPNILAKPIVHKKTATKSQKDPTIPAQKIKDVSAATKNVEPKKIIKPETTKTETISKKKNAENISGKSTIDSAKETSSTTEKPSNAREVHANPGDDIEVSFSRDGWIFLGFAKPSDSKAISFISRKTQANQTFFNFKANAEGIYDLIFSRQDNSSGNDTRENVRVYVDPALGAGASTKSQANIEGKTADELYNAQMYKEALAKYLENNSESSPFLNDRIAELYKKTGSADLAAKFWQKNIEIPGDFADKAVVEIAKLYTEKKDQPGLEKFVSQLAGTEGIPYERYIALIARYLDKSGENASDISIIRSFIAGHSDAANVDEFYFMLGKLYEKDTPVRDLHKSMMYYKKVCNEYPESYFFDAATERINYLNRYFFIIK
jgi:hypothetical protein